jgi:uncharacterized protein (TIGR03000 family)
MVDLGFRKKKEALTMLSKQGILKTGATLAVAAALLLPGFSFARGGGGGHGGGGGGHGGGHGRGFGGGRGGGFGGGFRGGHDSGFRHAFGGEYGSGFYGGYYPEYSGTYYPDESTGSYYADPGYYSYDGATYSSGNSSYSPVAPNNRAHVTLRVPAADAIVWIEGVQMKESGITRDYQSPPLEQGHNYNYEIRAQWTQDGKTLNQTQKFPIHAGEQVLVAFDKPSATEKTAQPAAKDKVNPMPHAD